MKTFRTLELAIQFNDSVNELKISGHLREQLVRAASSIALNLAEGNAKMSVKEKKRFYQTSYASLKECQTIFRLVKNENQEVVKLADHLGACLYKLTRSELTAVKTQYSEH